MRRVFSIILIVTFILALTATSTLAKNPTWDEQKALIEKEMVQAYGQGTVDDVDKVLKKYGFELVAKKEIKKPIETKNSETNISPMSTGNDATLRFNYYRSWRTGKYLVNGFWEWNGRPYDQNNNPSDAFGLWMRKVSDGSPATGQYMESDGYAVYDSTGYNFNNMWQSDFDAQNAGVAWGISDVLISPDNYIGHKGQGWIWMTNPPAQDFYLIARYLHTYNFGTISGISIGSSGLTFNLSPETYSWQLSDSVLITSWPEN